MYGWMGKILDIDLTTHSIEVRELPIDLAQKYLGGRGLGARIVWDNVPPTTDPLSPANILVFATGPLTATKAPATGRATLSTRSPLTGTIHDSNVGGSFGVKLKQAGYDALIIRGKAPKPVYLSLSEKGVEIKEAPELWGKDTFSTLPALKQGENSSVICIGPAGENLVRFAAIIAEGRRAFGRGGVGAVMGSKNLKAIVVEGSKKPRIADPEQFDFIVYEARKQIRANPITSKGLPQFGTSMLVNILNEIGAFPTRNYREPHFEGAENISGEALERLLVKRTACWGCPIGCGREIKIGEEVVHGPEYETIWAFGAACGIDDLETIVQANLLCNKLGLDTISTGATIACAMELSQQGLLNERLSFGDAALLPGLIEQIAYRQGIGDLLAEGSKRLAERCGAPEVAMQVKGLELPAYDPRGMKGQGLAYATSNRGGCHLRANMLGPEVLGAPKLIDRFATSGKAGIVIVIQNSWAAADSLVACVFATFAISDEYFARLLTAALGKEYKAQDLQRIGERIYNLERLYNLRAGFTRKDDTLPLRILEQPHTQGPSSGQKVELQKMLEEYYRFRGWDADGKPTAKKLAELGLLEEDQNVPGI
ncbi:aldehyde ferredoxin oxidoreductase family protein [Moorellaceae bacterium AZ2]